MLKEWRTAGDRLVVCLDANENIYTQALGKMLTDPEGLGMIEAVGGYTGKKIGPTYFRGQLPIDGIWTTSDVTVANACIMPAGYGIGDHSHFLVSRARPTEGTTSSIKKAQYSSPACRKKIYREPGGKPEAAQTYREVGGSSLQGQE